MLTKSVAHVQIAGAYAVDWSVEDHGEGALIHVITYGQEQFEFGYQDDVAAAREFGNALWHALVSTGKFDRNTE
jgi:hypothetical protein